MRNKHLKNNLESQKRKLWELFFYLRAKLSKHKIIKSINKIEFGNIYEAYKNADPSPGYSKYLDLPKWIEVNLVRYYRIGLNNKGPYKILDIGTGCGYFPYICKFYGHKVKSLDVPTEAMYNDIVTMLNIDRTEYTINAYEKLPDLSQKFDIVTAFMICFNGHNTENLWSVSEWKFFLSNLARDHMAETGKVYLLFNTEKDGMFLDSDLYQYFQSIGAKIETRAVTIDNLIPLLSPNPD